MYQNAENVDIVTRLLKEHSINRIVISPGGTNIPFIKAIQDDDFFSCYCVVDERSAAYFAIGVALQTGAPVALLCTSAQATRNYIPGLTEAFYKRVPILAITMEKHPRFKYQEYMQAPDQTSLPKDSVKKTFELPYISDIQDRFHSIRVTNEAMLELTKGCPGPIQLCVPWLDFPLEEHRPAIRKIERMNGEEAGKINVTGKRVLIVIGERAGLKETDIAAMNDFCDRANAAIYTNHLSNFRNRYSVNGNLLLSVINDEEFNLIKPDILITLGGQTGDYPFFLRFSSNRFTGIEHWRISNDGAVIDTYDKLTKVIEGEAAKCFGKISCDSDHNHEYYEKWALMVRERRSYIPVPFSNVAVAAYLHDIIPNHSIIQFSILNSLRVWNLFELDQSIECYSNVGAFGIDGGMSTLIGQSVVSEKKAFMIIGDLAFFYDMNSLGIRHVKNNLRVLLINNNGGIEFKLHGGDKSDIDRYIAAGNHNRNAEGWAKTCGFQYMSARSMEEFAANVNSFIGESSQPIVFEIFVSDEDESDAYHALIEANKTKTVHESFRSGIKSSVKCLIGENAYKALKRKIKKNGV